MALVNRKNKLDTNTPSKDELEKDVVVGIKNLKQVSLAYDLSYTCLTHNKLAILSDKRQISFSTWNSM